MDDLEVHIADLDAQHQIYAVRVTLADGRNFIGSVQLQDLRPAPDGSVSDLEAYGLDLFNRLFNDSLADAFDHAWSAARAKDHGVRLRLWLASDDNRLHQVPWELLYYDDSGGLSPPLPIATSDKVAFSRYLASTEPWGEPIQQRPLRMLVVISAPRDLGSAWPDLAPIDKGIEKRDLRSIFSVMHSSGQLDFAFLEPATEEALHRALDEDYHVLLYYGHALHHPQRGTWLVLEDASGNGTLYDGAELVRRVKQRQKRPQLIVLVACNTATQRDDYPLGSLAARLVQQGGVPAVLAMQRLVEVALARNFTHHLSEFLLQHGIVDVAVNSARRRIAESNRLNWSTPVLYMRSVDGRLFAPNAVLDYARVLQDDPQFGRWKREDFIRVETIPVPQGQHWAMVQHRPEDAPPSQDALEALRQDLRLDRERVEPNVIALIGPPRSGQTTTLQRLALDLAEEAQRKSAVRRVIGVYVSLASYGQKRSTGRRIHQLIIETVREQVPALEDELQRLFQPGTRLADTHREVAGFVFLLDGLDTIAEPYLLTASEEIVALARELPGHRFVVSCTQYRFPVKTFERARVLLLQPISERQVVRYLRQRDPHRSAVLFRQMAESRLLDLATNPALLVQIYERLAQSQATAFTRNQVMQDLLDGVLGDMSVSYGQGDIARETLIALAWEMRWRHTDTLPLWAVFRIMATVRRERDYSLEQLYQVFLDTQLLAQVGRDMVRFVHPMVHAYCAALALSQRPDFEERLNDIIAMCGISERLAWWEDVLYALAGLLKDAGPLRPLADAAFAGNSGPHTLLVARCLEALSREAEQSMSNRVLQELLDACVVRLRVEREPLAERRAQIATALGRLHYPQAVRELRRLLVERVRSTRSGARYDHTNVRVAAARALRTLVTRLQVCLTVEDGGGNGARQRGAQILDPESCGPILALKDELMSQDPALFRLLSAWSDSAVGQGDLQRAGLTLLRKTLADDAGSALERTVAAFALGDLAISPDDATLLRDMIVCPPPTTIAAEEWNDITWSAADALTLFDPERVGQLLGELFEHGPPPEHSVRQIAYIAGRVRVQHVTVLRWLIALVLHNPDHAVKAVALRSLAWMGKGVSSVGWLHEAVHSLYPNGWKGSLDALVLKVVTAIVAWHVDELRPLGAFDGQAQDDDTTIYLRSKAIEALAWIGDGSTLDTLYQEVHTWPLELREVWYVTAKAIRARLSARRETGASGAFASLQ